MIASVKRYFFNVLYSFWDKKQKKRLASIKDNQKVYVFDIDNTLTVSEMNAPLNHVSPRPRKGMITYAQNMIATEAKIIYLSARNFKLFDTTLDWLKKHNIFKPSENDLFLVNSSISKIEYLEFLIQNNESIVFIDDLSYNYENGEVKFYDKTEKIISALKLDYKGLDFIEAQ